MKEETFLIDSCTIFDFDTGGLLDRLFKAPFRLCTTDLIVFDELEDPSGHELKKLGLIEIELDGRTLQELLPFVEKHRAIKRNDAILLGLAKSRNMHILTSDKNLRKVAETEGVRVHGTLWLLERYVDLHLIDPQEAVAAIIGMLAGGRRLPESECTKHIARWKAMK